MRATRSKPTHYETLEGVPCTFVHVQDDLTGSRREFDLPVEAQEAWTSCAAVEQARYFVDRISMFADGDDMSLGVSIRKARGVILIRWFAVDGDDAKALAEREDEWDELQGGRT